MQKALVSVMLLLLALTFSGCARSIPKNALQLSPESLANRQIQTRRFETANNEVMLSAAAAVFQDLGFTLEESEYELGIIVGSKHRDATSGAQVAGAVLLAALTGAYTHVDSDQVIKASMVMRAIETEESKKAKEHKLTPEILAEIKRETTKAVSSGLRKHFPEDISSRIAANIGENTAKTLTSDLAKVIQVRDSGESTVRVTFQRVVYNTAGQVTTREQINSPELYQQFFEKLSQSVFLEAHEL